MPISVDKKHFEQVKEITFTQKNEITAKIDLSEDDLGLVIFESANAFLEFEECSQGEVRYAGKAHFSILYGDAKKIETGVEFSFKEDVKGVESGDSVLGNVCVENVKAGLKNGIATITAVLIYKGNVKKKEQTEYLCSANGVCVKKQEVEISANPVKYASDFQFEDEFEIPVAITDVLWHGENVNLTSVTSQIGSVAFEGEVEVNLLVKTAEGLVLKQTKALPLRFEGEAINVLPSSKVVACAVVKGAKISVTSYEQSNKSSVAVYVTLSFGGYVYETEVCTFISDAYSLTNEVVLDKKEYKLTEIKGAKVENCRALVDGAVKIPENAGLICPLFVKIESVEQADKNGESALSGVATITLLVKDEAGYKTIKTPVSYSAKCGCSTNVLCANASNLTATANGGEVALAFGLNVVYVDVDEKAVSAVCSINEGELRPVCDSAITICVPEPGDSLWELTKTLGVTEEEITKLNGDLNYPLTGEERIVIYREINKE